MRTSHQKQLEVISTKLFLFESSLKAKEQKLQEIMRVKDQVFKQLFLE